MPLIFLMADHNPCFGGYWGGTPVFSKVYPMKYLLSVLLILPFVLTGQFVSPPASAPANSTITAGYTDLSVDYHRPNLRGRRVFGHLLPWGDLWRAGANENTLLTFSRPVVIGETNVPAGTYSVFIIPEERAAWTWVLNSQTDQWGAKGYDDRKDIVRIAVKPQKLRERIESLEFRWLNVGPQTVDLTLEWEWMRVSLSISLDTDAQVAKQVATHLNPAKDPKEYYAAARYHLDNGLDLQQAKAWMDRWAAEDKEQFGRMRYQAIIEYKLGNDADGRRLMERSLELAQEASNEHYVRMNKQSLKDWSRDLTEMSADSLLSRSIRYHDPQGHWGKKPHILNLAESRPSGGVRHSRLTMFPAKNEFDLVQTRGVDKIQLRFVDGTFSATHQGRMEIREKDRERLRLTKENTLWLRDYYTYLFGLPMKLRDEGTELMPNIHKVWFQGEQLLELEVHYAPETGKDIWFFYFNPETYALQGYSFYHEKDGPGTGEYIILEGEAVVDKMRLPAERHWYYTHNNLYLGTDQILR